MQSTWTNLFQTLDLKNGRLSGLQDRLPLLQNFAGFLLAAAIFRLSPLFKPGATDTDLISKQGRKLQDEKDLNEK